ncbi:MAG: bifunctional demethylmenaquinone methyltransferase/2-methoxy-6-polyprenyl-1,4-benzoquinol methylase UbiE [Ignavibacteriae bacterium]|nr:bifunctional demethylmenaquinone methyltransferase/2-methoxy-6-polyprenyl-1,4-benzoquinol methylase UbiE [Ignavibacteriota bacterium]
MSNQTAELSLDEAMMPDAPHRTTYEKAYVRSLFDRVAHRYDLLNHLLSSGIDVYWRAKAVRLLGQYQPKEILDVATGTADLSIRSVRLQPKRIVGIDISEEMLKLGREKIAKRRMGHIISLQTGDAERLPFAEGEFDAVTVAFGVRNFSDLTQGLREMHRVLRPHGVAVILEFSQPTVFPVKQLHAFFLKRALPAIGGFVSKQREAYEYLPKTINEFPDGGAMIEVLRESGFTSVTQHRMTFGIATVYIAQK